METLYRGSHDSKGMTEHYRHAHGRDDKSINLLSDAPVHGSLHL